MKRILIWIAIVLTAVELSYLLASTILLNSAFFRHQLNQNPESLDFHYDIAWSLLPGVVQVRGFTFRLQDNDIQLYLKN